MADDMETYQPIWTLQPFLFSSAQEDAEEDEANWICCKDMFCNKHTHVHIVQRHDKKIIASFFFPNLGILKWKQFCEKARVMRKKMKKFVDFLSNVDSFNECMKWYEEWNSIFGPNLHMHDSPLLVKYSWSIRIHGMSTSSSTSTSVIFDMPISTPILPFDEFNLTFEYIKYCVEKWLQPRSIVELMLIFLT
jgi:hypothetical protein